MRRQSDDAFAFAARRPAGRDGIWRRARRAITASAPQRSDAGGAEIVAFLSTPAAYNLHVNAPQVIETHMSWVFLTRDRVFKLKKSLHTPFLDYSTLEAREKFCSEEIRLNKRLAPDVYLRAVPVVRLGGGELCIGGEGDIVDWLVEMRRLPAARMLDRALKDGTATASDIDRAIDYLFAFLSSAPPAAVDEERYLNSLRKQHCETRRILIDKAWRWSRKEVLDTLRVLRATIETRPDWLLEPVRRRRIIEGHGDLRPEHICLTDPPAIIDCLEFNEELRLLDPFDELSYLALECRLLGAIELADRLASRYADRVGFSPPAILLDFYTAYRAAIRARLALTHIFDWRRDDRARWIAQADAYIALAHTASLNLRRREAR